MIEVPALAAGAKVVGVGIDVVDVERFRRSLARTPRLGPRVFSAAELETAGGDVVVLAGCFAVKEAVLKSLGLGIFAMPLSEIEHLRAADGIRCGPTVTAAARDAGASSWKVAVEPTESVVLAVVVACR